MKNLNEDIKTGNFRPVYLLYGEEAYLKKQYKDKLTKAIFPDGDTMNYAYFEGKGIAVTELIDLGSSCDDGGATWFFSSYGGILEVRRGIQDASCVGPGKSNLPLELRRKAGHCSRVTAGPIDLI